MYKYIVGIYKQSEHMSFSTYIICIHFVCECLVLILETGNSLAFVAYLFCLGCALAEVSLMKAIVVDSYLTTP